MTLLAVRAIDLAIFATLGGLWVGGAIFIVVLYKWIARFERSAQPPDAPAPLPAAKARTSAAQPDITGAAHPSHA